MACRKEPSLPVLHPINEAVISGIDPVYRVDMGEAISIYPKVHFTQDSLVSDTSRYQYEWVYITRPPLLNLPKEFVVISTDKELVDYVVSSKIMALYGPFDFTFRIIDTYTDTYTEFPFRIELANKYYEGWVVLMEKEGATQVDMLSYHIADDTFIHLADVLRFESQARQKPVFITEAAGFSSELGLGGILVGTDQQVVGFAPGDFRQVVSFYPGFVSSSELISPSMVFQTASLNHFLYADGTYYNLDERSGYAHGRYFEPISNLQTEEGLKPFHAAPFVALSSKGRDSETILFNEDNDEFVWHDGPVEFCMPLVAPNRFARDEPLELVFLDYTRDTGGHYVGILRGLDSRKLYWIKFTPYELLGFEQVADGSALYHADNIALNRLTGGLYVNVGKELFECTLSGDRKLTTLDDEITLLKYERFTLLSVVAVNGNRYWQYEDMLVIATHNDANPNDSGTLMLYDTQNNQIFQQFKGFGKVVDVTYKEQ